MADTAPATIAELQAALKKQTAKVRQLEIEIEARQEEYDRITADNLRQNEELLRLNTELKAFNEELELKVQERTRDLVASQKILEQQSQELRELSAAKDALAHMIVHDLKNPLTVIMGALAIFKSGRMGLAPEYHDLAVKSYGQSLKLLHMIEEILTINRMQSKEFQLKTDPVDPAALARQCVETMSKTVGDRRLSLRFLDKGGAPVINADADLLERVINNLINNSIKYAPPESEILIELSSTGLEILLSVSNQGESIPPEFHKKIFELFTRVNAKDRQMSGAGLGLAFCKLAVEAHQGRLWVTSPAPPSDHGARFTLAIPITPDRASAIHP